MAYDPKAIANYFLDLAGARGVDLSPMKIQKLVYFAHGWHLAIKGAPLINEQVEAWRFGPVIPSLYRAFRRYGNQPVAEPAFNVYPMGLHNGEASRRLQVCPNVDSPADQSASTKAFLNRVWDVYGDYTAIQLSNLTHQEGTPWFEVKLQYEGQIPKGTDIPSTSMRDHFLKLAGSKATSR